MRKRGRSVSLPPTVTVEEPVRKKRILVYTFICAGNPLFFTPIFLKRRGHPRPRGTTLRLRLPQLFKRRSLMGLPRLVRRNASSWFVLVINAPLVSFFALLQPSFFRLSPCSGISLVAIMDVCRGDDCA